MGHQLRPARPAIGVLGLDAEFGREVLGREIAAGACVEERVIVRFDQPAAGRVHIARQLLVADRAARDQIAAVAGQDAAPVDPLAIHGCGPGRDRGIVDIGDIARLVGIDEIGRGNVHPREDTLPFVERAGLVEPVIGVELTEIAHPAIADGEGTLVVLHHRPVHAAPDVAPDRQDDRPDADRQRHRALFEVAPLAVETIAIAAVVQHQLVDINHVGRVDRIGPAEIGIVAEERVGAPGEIGAGEMPAFTALYDKLVPCDAAAPGLVRVGDQRRRPAGFLGRDGKCVGAAHRRFLARGQGERAGVGERL